jgi:hypothetical protein
MKDLVINNKEDALERQAEEAKDWTQLYMKEAFQDIKEPIIYGVNNFSGIFDPSNS